MPLAERRLFRGARSKRWRLMKEAVVRAGATAYRDRRRRKRDFRSLWVIRLTAACRARGIGYSRFEVEQRSDIPTHGYLERLRSESPERAHEPD